MCRLLLCYSPGYWGLGVVRARVSHGCWVDTGYFDRVPPSGPAGKLIWLFTSTLLSSRLMIHFHAARRALIGWYFFFCCLLAELRVVSVCHYRPDTCLNVTVLDSAGWLADPGKCVDCWKRFRAPVVLGKFSYTEVKWNVTSDQGVT